MPAWKREIIERRRAKIGSGASFSETSGHAEGSSCSQSDTVAGAPGANNPDQGRAHVRMEESTVLRENIGPVNQNPFIKLERQRKDCSEAEASPKVRQIAELYSQMPGVRTIRAENIIIIESDPQYFSRKEAKEEETKPRNLEALTELMSKRGGSGVTEIRASEVLIIKSSLSRSVEDLNSMKREEEEGEEGGPGGRGRVSQLLSKFGHEKGWRPMRSRSTENIMDNASRQFEAKSEMRPHEVQYPESPHRSLGHPEVGLRDFSPCTIETTSDSHHDSEGTPSFHPTESHHVSADESNIPSLHSINETTVTPRRSLGPGVIGDVVVDCSGEAEKKASSSSLTLHESKSKPTPNLKQAVSASTSLNDSFEIHPASTPDLSGISEDDVQAKALAGLRLQSKNSFVVVPKQQEVGSQPKLPAALSHSSPSCARELLCAAEVASCVASVETSLSFSEDGPPAVRNEKAVAQVQPIPAASPDSELSLPLAGLNQGLKVGRTESPEEPPARSMIPELGSRAPRHPAMQRKSGNTITINPRKMAASKPAAPENGEATETETAKKAEGPKAATPSKKRYPTVEEIQVIGGYLSLERSCLAKKNATRKKVR
uniref:Taperin n=1 Tax=Latimeria chalumnae TaxID=7897 RepID=H3A0H7_LATCH